MKASRGGLGTSNSAAKGLRGVEGCKNTSKGSSRHPGRHTSSQRPTKVQKMHWHWAKVVICSSGYSPRHSLQDTRGSRARSHVGRYRAVVMAEQSETREAQAIRPSQPPPQLMRESLAATRAPEGGKLTVDGSRVSENSLRSSEKF